MGDTGRTLFPAVPYKLTVGYNYPHPFDDYGYNLGPNPYDFARQDPRWKSTLPRNLAKLKAAGIEVVRWFLLGNGMNWGFAPQWTVLPTPPLVRSEGWRFDPPDPIDPRFLQHFELALQYFRQEGMKFIPSLIDAAMIGGGDRYNSPPVSTPPASPVYKEINGRNELIGGNWAPSGRYDMVNDIPTRDTFFRTLLEPFLNISGSEVYRDVIYAWEVMNEPTWAAQHADPLNPIRGGFVTEDRLREFLQAVLDRIKNHHLPSTVGHRYLGDTKSYPTGDMPQFHYYPGLSEIFVLPNKPSAFLGEFGSAHPGQYKYGTWAVDPSEPWPELNGADTSADTIIYSRLELLEKKRFSCAIIWPDLSSGGYPPLGSGSYDPTIATDDTLKLSPNKLQQVRKFTSRYGKQ